MSLRLFQKQIRFKLLLAFVALFVASTSFCLIATFTRQSSLAVAYTDLSMALILVILSIAIYLSRKRRRLKGKRAVIVMYRTMFATPLLLIPVYLIAPGVSWDLLLIGLSWRFWLLSIMLEDLYEIYRCRMKDQAIQRPAYL